MTLSGKIFGVAFIFVILLGTVALAGVYLQKSASSDPAYTAPNTTLNTTEQTLQAWTAPQVNELGLVAFLALIFALCTGIGVMVFVKGKRRV
jgi:hypothetical protein